MDDDSTSSMPTIARISAAFEGNDLVRMDDSSVSSTPTIARIPAAFEGNELARMDDSSVPSTPTVTRSPTALEGNTAASNDYDHVPYIPMMAQSLAAFEGNRPATTNSGFTSSITPVSSERSDDGTSNSLRLSITGNVTKKCSKKLTLPTITSYAHCSHMRNYHSQCLVSGNSLTLTIQVIVTLEEFPPCQRPNHQPPPFRPGSRWRSSPPPHLMSSTAPFAASVTNP